MGRKSTSEGISVYETYKQEIRCEGKPKVAFVCVHNSCRSQIAEALGKKLASDVFESYSAGTELKDHINPDAVRIMKMLHGISLKQISRGHPRKKGIANKPPI